MGGRSATLERAAPEEAIGEPPVPAKIANLPHLRDLWIYWSSKRGDRPMALRSDFLPYEIPALLPHLTIIERIGGRFRYRLMGTAVAQSRGTDSTGKFFDEVFAGSMLSHANGNCALVFESARPHLAKSTYVSGFGVPYRATRLMLPLADQHAQVAVLLIGNVFELDQQAVKWLFDTEDRPLDNTPEPL